MGSGLGLGLELGLVIGLKLGSGLEHAETAPVDSVAVTLVEDELGREILGRATPATHGLQPRAMGLQPLGVRHAGVPHRVHVAPVTSLANPKSASCEARGQAARVMGQAARVVGQAARGVG